MEEYNHELNHHHHQQQQHQRGNNLSYVTSSILGPNNSSSTSPSSSYVGRTTTSSPLFHHQSFLQPQIIKTEAGVSPHFPRFNYPLLPSYGRVDSPTLSQHHHQDQDANDVGGVHLNHINNHNSSNNNNSSCGSHEVDAIKAKIISHPQYSNLLEAYLACQKVGAPPEVAARLAAAQQEFEARQRASFVNSRDGSKDPELDQFMEAYYDMLVKYREELTRPVQEAMDFMRKIEAQLNVISNGRVSVLSTGMEIVGTLWLCLVIERRND
ncbi:Homeotic protein knotted-1 [Bienertia sinuspersici]